MTRRSTPPRLNRRMMRPMRAMPAQWKEADQRASSGSASPRKPTVTTGRPRPCALRAKAMGKRPQPARSPIGFAVIAAVPFPRQGDRETRRQGERAVCLPLLVSLSPCLASRRLALLVQPEVPQDAADLADDAGQAGEAEPDALGFALAAGPGAQDARAAGGVGVGGRAGRRTAAAR